jgi:2-polyprenyl-3-methyl-5-hydroxy-6-metoxy-1,4-benzoquinol methylase
MKTYALRTCPSCHGVGSADVVLRGTKGLHTLRQCTACGLVYASEYADPDEVYVDGYLRGETEFGLDIMHPLFQEFLSYAANRRLAAVEDLLGGPGTLLDVGCGSGEVMLAAQQRGWRATGAEPVAESAAIAVDRGLDVKNARLEQSGLPEGSYDVISAFHVLEHMSDGTGFLQSIARWARPGGYVVVEVPNFQSFHRRGYGADWPGLRPLEHITHYSPRTLDATLKRAGLEVASVRTMSFLWEKQTLDQRLADLARHRWRRYLARLSRPSAMQQNPGLVPGSVAAAILDATQSAYDVVKMGQVILGIGRVST